MDGHHLARARDVGHEHSGPDDVAQAEARVGQGRLNDRQDRPRLSAKIPRMERPTVGSGIGGPRDPA